MLKRFVPLVGLLAILVVPILAQKERSVRTIPMKGSVVGLSGAPLVGAHVALIRHTESDALNVRGMDTLARGETDQAGAFDLGAVDLRSEMQFPLETSIRLEYVVSVGGVARHLAGVKFTAPRSGPEYTVTSVEAKLTVY